MKLRLRWRSNPVPKPRYCGAAGLELHDTGYFSRKTVNKPAASAFAASTASENGTCPAPRGHKRSSQYHLEGDGHFAARRPLQLRGSHPNSDAVRVPGEFVAAHRATMPSARYNRIVHYIRDIVPYYWYQYLWQRYNMFFESTQKAENLFLSKLTFSAWVSTIILGDSRGHISPGALGFAIARCVKAAFRSRDGIR
jgi:hypothetical protein